MESVAWITERKNLLSTFFYLLSALCYLRYEPPMGGARERGAARWWAAAFALFLCALTSKAVSASLPAAIALVFWWKRGRLAVESLRPLAPFVAAGLAFGLLTAWMEKHLVGAAGAGWDFGVVERVLIAGRAVCFYLGKLVFPAQLSFVYPRWDVDAALAWQYLFPMVAAGLLVLAWAGRRRFGRGPLVALLYFGGTLVPALGFFDVYPFRFSFVADHFQYLASIGPIAFAAALVARAAERAPALVVPLALLGLVALGAQSFRQSQVYENLETLFLHAIAANPAAYMAHTNLAVHYHETGRHEEAARHFRETLRIRPELRDAHANLAGELGLMDDREGAIREYEKEIALHPDHVKAHWGMAILMEQAGRPDEAIAHYAAMLRAEPGHTVAAAKFERLRRAAAQPGQ